MLRGPTLDSPGKEDPIEIRNHIPREKGRVNHELGKALLEVSVCGQMEPNSEDSARILRNGHKEVARFG
jgi:hypothetical protein